MKLADILKNQPAASFAILIGPYGCGKTTALLSAASELHQQSRLVLVIDAKNYTGSPTYLLDEISANYCGASTHSATDQLRREQICNSLRETGCIIVIDSFDQTPDYAEVLAQAEILHEKLGDARFVLVTSHVPAILREKAYPAFAFKGIPEETVLERLRCRGLLPDRNVMPILQLPRILFYVTQRKSPELDRFSIFEQYCDLVQASIPADRYPANTTAYILNILLPRFCYDTLARQEFTRQEFSNLLEKALEETRSDAPAELRGFSADTFISFLLTYGFHREEIVSGVSYIQWNYQFQNYFKLISDHPCLKRTESDATNEIIKKSLDSKNEPLYQFINTPVIGPSRKYWVTRDEQSTLWQLLMQKKICAVTGPPGVGKTAFIKHFSELAIQHGFRISLCTYSDSLLASLTEILQPQPPAKEHAQLHAVRIALKAHEKTILIVDNVTSFDVTHEPVFRELLETGCYVLFTSQLDWSDYSLIGNLRLSKLPASSLTALLRKYTKKGTKEELEELISLVHSNTYGTELLGKLLRRDSTLQPAALKQLLSNISCPVSQNPVAVNEFTDDERSLLCVFKHLFIASNLSPDVVRILSFSSLMPGAGLPYSLFFDCISTSGMDAFTCIDEACDSGWLKYDEVSGNISMDRLARVVLSDSEYRPTVTGIHGIAEGLFSFWFGDYRSLSVNKIADRVNEFDSPSLIFLENILSCSTEDCFDRDWLCKLGYALTYRLDFTAKLRSKRIADLFFTCMHHAFETELPTSFALFETFSGFTYTEVISLVVLNEAERSATIPLIEKYYALLFDNMDRLEASIDTDLFTAKQYNNYAVFLRQRARHEISMNQAKALELRHKAYQHAPESKKTKCAVAVGRSYHSIGSFLYANGDYSEAIKNHQYALQYLPPDSSIGDRIATLHDLSGCYWRLLSNGLSQEQIDNWRAVLDEVEAFFGDHADFDAEKQRTLIKHREIVNAL